MTQQVAIVTGATKGIGYAIAQQLIRDDYLVIGTYVREYDAGFVESLETENFKLMRVDARSYEACESFVSEVSSVYSNISVLVNNAGVVKDDLILRMSPDAFQDVLDVNLTGTFNMVKALSRIMLRQKSGSIVNISSVIGIIGNVGQSNYAASKAGMIGFSKSIAKEFASRNIRVNCVAPGFIETEMTKSLSDSVQDGILNTIALKTFGTVEDVANAVSFLVSDKARYITGQTLNVCGGLVI